MMDCHRESRKRLRPWLERMVGNKNCPGLVWENKDMRTFRIPWRHYNNKDWHEKDSQIFMEWAKYTGKFDGEKLEYPVWKTRLRCALKKIPEIKELPDQHHLEDPDPYRVYQFVDTPLMKKSTDIDSDYSASPGSSAFTNSPVGRDYLEESMTPSPPKYCEETFLNSKPTNVPTVVYDDEHFNYNNLAVKTEATCPSHFTRDPTNCHTQLNDKHFERYHCLETYNISGRPDFLQQMPSTSQNYSDMDCIIPSCQPELPMLANGTYDEMQVEPENMKSSLPSDLISVESSDLCLLSLPSGTNLSLSEIQTSVDLSKTDHVMQITLFYGDPHKEVLKVDVTANGCRLFFGKTQMRDVLMEEELYGPKTVNQIEIPDVKIDPNISNEQKMFISDLLDNMERGIVLTYKDDCIYAQRLCRTRVFWSDGIESTLLDRKQVPVTKLFDYAAYKAAFENYHMTKNSPLPAPFFYLTIGQEVKKNRSDPMRRVLIHAKVQHTGAVEFASKYPPDSSHSLIPLMSSYDTNDQLLQKFKNMAVNNK